MRQAIEEGFILDVLAGYTTYSTYYKLASQAPDDPEVPVDKARAELVRFVSLHPSNLEAKAEIVVEHFRSKTRGKIGGAAKAMVVTRSREHAVRYFQAIQRYLARKGYDAGPRPISAVVAFSGSLDLDGATYTEAFLNGFGEAELPKRFASPDHQLLVVAEKYQTGFDQPLLHTMYVDKKLSGVKAVQTLSRLNRTAPGKEDTFVLDFANTVDEIRDSFAQFYDTTLALEADPNDAYNLERTLMDLRVLDVEEMDEAVSALLSGQTRQQQVIYRHTGRAVERFAALEDDDRETFRTTLASYVRAYAFLGQVMTWTDRELERLYLFGKVLLTQLPKDPDDPLPPVSDAVELTHLRVAVTFEGDGGVEDGDEAPGEVLPGGGQGRAPSPLDRLSALVERLNERFGIGTSDADKIWFEQQRLDIAHDPELRVVAQHNDRDAFTRVMKERLPHHVANRQQENSRMFDMFFGDPRFKAELEGWLAGAYDEFRESVG